MHWRRSFVAIFNMVLSSMIELVVSSLPQILVPWYFGLLQWNISMWGFFTASIYFYLFEDFSIVLSITVFSTVTLPGPEKKKTNNKPSHDDKPEEHIPKSLQLPTLLGQILSFSVPPFTWKYLVRKSFGELAWVLVKFSAKYHPNRYPQKPLSRKASDWIETWFKPLLCYYREFLQLDKFALPPSFGEIVQSRGKKNCFAPQYNWRMYNLFNNCIYCSSSGQNSLSCQASMSFWAARRGECNTYICLEPAPSYGN